MTGALVEAYSNALRAMEDNAPKGLVRRALVEAEDIDPELDVSEPRLREHLAASGPNDTLRVAIHLNLAKWDYAPIEGNAWTCGTRPNTDERRALVIKALQLDDETAQEFKRHFPIFSGDGTTVIAGPWDPWYTKKIQRERSFYWKHYVDYLRVHRKWGAEAIADLDVATTRVVERLIEPSREKAGQTKGLVVGYVQSGKTANFTGVIAKAIDAGYRLIIVMTGTTNLLREQTQRRLDMELVGRENLLRGADENDESARERVDYLDDEDWAKGKFVSHGARPSDIGKPDIHRMTTRNFDYRKLQQGLPALEFERRDRTKPLWHPDNLFTSDARLSIVKKNTSVLNNLIKDLRNTADKLENIPTLIIDDESDQASINTVDPKKWVEEKKKRTAINKHISSLLRMLPRAQYIGYTATPFANVFVDPSDDEDIFPKDYLIALQRPVNYMGAEDFHDLDLPIPENEKTFVNSKERAHLRLLEHDEETELRLALDSFVLAGAIKLFRLSRAPDEFERPFKDHTMLVHESMRKDPHRARADSIRELWCTGGYLSGGAVGRLRDLFERDFGPVMAALDMGYPSPGSFDELVPHLGAAARKIAPNGNPVLIVNSDKDILQEELDFDKRPVWRVLVGGNKLARGFTVEGLTVTYYSRSVGHAEALMQMGRWFGFRPGYRDLVRLFITPGVRDAFEAACRDEEDFRNELRQYAVMVDGRPVVTPEHIQPLVSRHGLRPTAPNKMYNARLAQRRTLTKEPSSGYPKIDDQEALDSNIDACVPLLKAAVAENLKTVSGARGSFDAFVGTVSHETMVDVLKKLKWSERETFRPDIAWIAGLSDSVIRGWEVVLPQQKTRAGVNFRDVGRFTIHGRKIEREVHIRGNAESKHREIIDELSQKHPRMGYALLYPVMNRDLVNEPMSDDGYPRGVVMAFRLRLPGAAVPEDRQPLVYKVAVRGEPLYAVVDRQ